MIAQFLAVALLSLPAAAGRDSALEDVPASSAALKGVHLSGWAAGSTKARTKFISAMTGAGFNAVVIALRDADGKVFVPGIILADETKAYVRAIPDLAGAVRDFRSHGVYTIARVAVFKDDNLPWKRPELAVRKPNGKVWTGDNGTAWLDPYLQENRDYAIEIASRAALAGFDEIQFDYIRFPSDGKTRQCRYAEKNSTPAAEAEALKTFLSQAHDRLKPLGVKLSMCIFGLTTSVDNGMGIGQHLDEMASYVDYISPMMYPSHYAKGEYGLKNPNRQPYLTIHHGIQDALEHLGAQGPKLRPYLQDFSLGVRYTPAYVRAQIRAAEELGVREWLLWNAGNHYTWSAVQAGPMVVPSARSNSAPTPAPAASSALPPSGALIIQ